MPGRRSPCVRVPIAPDETSDEVERTLAELGAELVAATWSTRSRRDAPSRRRRTTRRATLRRKMTKAEGRNRLDPARRRSIHNQVRGPAALAAGVDPARRHAPADPSHRRSMGRKLPSHSSPTLPGRVVVRRRGRSRSSCAATADLLRVLDPARRPPDHDGPGVPRGTSRSAAAPGWRAA